MTTPTPEDDVKQPTIGDGFWIDRISVENLRHIFRNGTATMMLAPLGNCIDAIEDAKARIARLLDHIDAQAVRLEAAERDAARYAWTLHHLGLIEAHAAKWNPAKHRPLLAYVQDFIDTHRAAIASEANGSEDGGGDAHME